MLAQVLRAGRSEEWVVFLAWQPHPMNRKLSLTYLDGGDATLGANYGSSTVHTLARRGLTGECPNLARLMKQVTFTTTLAERLMGLMEDEKLPADEAALRTLKADPTVVRPWLQGVTTRDGNDGLAAVEAALAG